ncbi:DUF6097 family protein [Phyllobacterium sp. 0TCS1.6C]|uniref:DUF6097 family protein n=1 Tax=unclassified Phyllobacterium TaxID=2638441 RepID=UPI002264615B|nr:MULTISPECIES: DUF6097 family protein [unclassified Phyllobacterium]MCX8281073.1 DUF6097 family protein [Phyllobacterium sp. 0TCS1.6C]MCX8294640.1 DUF6097 family protein [Phyllobacterium sp. 0TCS1.6A]
MNFLSNFGAAMLLSQFAGRQLEGLHGLIDWKRIPVEKSDDFYKQTIALERVAGTGGFERRFKAYSLVRKSMVGLATVVIVPALALFVLSKIPSFEARITELMSWLMSDFMRFIYVAGGGSGVLLLLLIGAHFYTRSQLIRLLGPELGRLWLSLIERYAPELQQRAVQAHADPDEIARLIVDQRRDQ